MAMISLLAVFVDIIPCVPTLSLLPLLPFEIMLTGFGAEVIVFELSRTRRNKLKFRNWLVDKENGKMDS